MKSLVFYSFIISLALHLAVLYALVQKADNRQKVLQDNTLGYVNSVHVSVFKQTIVANKTPLNQDKTKAPDKKKSDKSSKNETQSNILENQNDEVKVNHQQKQMTAASAIQNDEQPVRITEQELKGLLASPLVRPKYPRHVSARGIQGTTTIRLKVENGEVIWKRISKSSGNMALDYSVFQVVNKWKFLDHVNRVLEYDVVFKLR